VKGASGEWVCDNVKYQSQSQERRDETGPSHLIVGRIIKSLNASSEYNEHALKLANLPLGSEVN
jgi:hypothetical protein